MYSFFVLFPPAYLVGFMHVVYNITFYHQRVFHFMHIAQRDARSPVDRHLDGFQFFVISNKDPVNVGTLSFATFSQTTVGTHFRELCLLLASFPFLQNRENNCYLLPKTVEDSLG